MTPVPLRHKRLTLIWLTLCIATIGGVGTMSSGGIGGQSFFVVIALAGLKAYLISSHFMHLQGGPRGWHLAFVGLAAAGALLIAALHWMATA